MVTARVRRKKTKAFTKRQLHRAVLRAERERKDEAKAERAQARRLAWRTRKALAPFEGCDPERTARLGDAHGTG